MRRVSGPQVLRGDVRFAHLGTTGRTTASPTEPRLHEPREGDLEACYAQAGQGLQTPDVPPLARRYDWTSTSGKSDERTFEQK